MGDPVPVPQQSHAASVEEQQSLATNSQHPRSMSNGYYSPLSGQNTEERNPFIPLGMNDTSSIYSYDAPTLYARQTHDDQASIAPSEAISNRRHSHQPRDHPTTIPTNANANRNATRTTTGAPNYGPGSPFNFSTEQEYMAALREWAEEKKYVTIGDGSTELTGFYGKKTMNDYIAEGEGLGFRSRRRKGGKGKQRRAVIAEEQEGDSADGGDHSTTTAQNSARKKTESVVPSTSDAGTTARQSGTNDGPFLSRDHEQEGQQEENTDELGALQLPPAARRRSSLGNWLRRVTSSDAGYGGASRDPRRISEPVAHRA